MKRNVFRPKDSFRTSFNPFREADLESSFYREVLRVRGKFYSDFEIYSEDFKTRYAFEQCDRRKWDLFEDLDWNAHEAGSNMGIASVTQTFWGSRRWGELKHKIELNYTDGFREFTGADFRIIHRDYQNSLEVWATSKHSLFIGTWFSFWYWFRQNQDNEGGTL